MSASIGRSGASGLPARGRRALARVARYRAAPGPSAWTFWATVYPAVHRNASPEVQASARAALYRRHRPAARRPPRPVGSCQHTITASTPDIWYELQPRATASRPIRDPRRLSVVSDDQTIDDKIFARSTCLIKTAPRCPTSTACFVNRWINARLCNACHRRIAPVAQCRSRGRHDDHFHFSSTARPQSAVQPQADFPHDDGCCAALDLVSETATNRLPIDDEMAKRTAPSFRGREAVLRAP